MNDAEFDAWLVAHNLEIAQQAREVASSVPDVKRLERAPSPSRPPRKRAKKNVEQQELVLLDNQVEHVERLRTILRSYPFALDLSMLGAGKTFTSSYLALHGVGGTPFKHVIVVCPVSVLPKWKTMSERYGIPIVHALGYQALRSSTHRQPKHGLLYRRDTARGAGLQTEFSSTPQFTRMVDEGTLLILDEIQNIKNISSQFLAAKTLIHEITRRPGSGLVPFSQPTLFQQVMLMDVAPDVPCSSRVLLLSGSPIDQKEHATHIFRSLGVMTHDRVAQMNIHSGRLEWRGMQEIYDFCLRANPIVPVIPTHNTIINSKLDPYIYKLFQSCLKPACSSAMNPPKAASKLTKENAFYDVDDEGAVIISRGLHSLKHVARFDGSTVNFQPIQVGGMHVRTGEQLAGVSRAMQVIETGKIQLFARIAREALQNPSRKVVVAVNYTDTITDLTELLADFSPLLLVGATSEAGRRKCLEQFQAPTTTHRLLLCNQSVASTGIDLDDKDGQFPRICFVSPNYSTIMSYQLGHRFQRLDTKSDATVHFVFAKRRGSTREASEDIIELKVLHALSRKSLVMRETTGGEGVVYPGDHAEWLESGSSSTPIVSEPKKNTRLAHFLRSASPMRQVFFADQLANLRGRGLEKSARTRALRAATNYPHFVGPLTLLQTQVKESVSHLD